MRFDRYWSGILALSLAATGCSSSSSSPSPPSITGTWAGAISDSFAGTGAARVTLSQSGSSLSGTWATTFSESRNNNFGTVYGSVLGSSVSVILVPANPNACGFNATATLSANKLNGTYTSISCVMAISGVMDLAKQ